MCFILQHRINLILGPKMMHVMKVLFVDCDCIILGYLVLETKFDYC